MLNLVIKKLHLFMTMINTYNVTNELEYCYNTYTVIQLASVIVHENCNADRTILYAMHTNTY